MFFWTGLWKRNLRNSSKKAAADDAAGTAAGTMERAAFFFAGSSSFAGSTAAVTAFGTSGADGAEAPSFGGVFGASAFGGVFGPPIFGGVLGASTTDGGFGASPHLLEGAATTCCVHSLAYPTFELHWVAEASLFLGKPVVQRARQLRRPEMRIQISEKILPRRTSQVPEPQLLPRCREQIAPRPHVADRGWSAFQYRQPR